MTTSTVPDRSPLLEEAVRALRILPEEHLQDVLKYVKEKKLLTDLIEEKRQSNFKNGCFGSKERIKEIRNSLGLTQAEFGKALGLAWYKVKDLESGRLKITEDIAKDINEKFGLMV